MTPWRTLIAGLTNRAGDAPPGNGHRLRITGEERRARIHQMLRECGPMTAEGIAQRCGGFDKNYARMCARILAAEGRARVLNERPIRWEAV